MRKIQEDRRAIGMAFLAAGLYALSSPASKVLLKTMQPTMMAAFLYLGAGAGMAFVGAVRRRAGAPREGGLTRRQLPYTIGMVALDIAAPIFLMTGLARTTAANVSLLNNFEIVATALIALALFHEHISRRLWCAIGLITAASVLLSVEDSGSFSFSSGSLLVLAACLCWGLENNCTRVLSSGDPLQVVVVKGLGSGTGSLVIAAAMGETPGAPWAILCTLILGFVAYGLSIFCYVYAQRTLGAAKTSAYYAAAPFVGAALSLFFLGERPAWNFFVALAVMAAGAYLASTDGK